MASLMADHRWVILVYMDSPLHQLGEAQPLCHFVEHLSNIPKWSWLYIAESVRDVGLRTACYLRSIDFRDLSDQEYEDFESAVHAAGLKCFLSRDQLADIVDNLAEQRSDYGSEHLEAAVDFYWKHDAFLTL